MIADHPFALGGKFGRCADCGRGRKSHMAEDPTAFPPPLPPPNPSLISHIDKPGANSDAPPASLYRTPGLPVYLHVKRRSGERGEDVRLDWPTDWPLPVAGNVIRIAGDPATVRSVVFDLDRDRIVLDCD